MLFYSRSRSCRARPAVSKPALRSRREKPGAPTAAPSLAAWKKAPNQLIIQRMAYRITGSRTRKKGAAGPTRHRSATDCSGPKPDSCAAWEVWNDLAMWSGAATAPNGRPNPSTRTRCPSIINQREVRKSRQLPKPLRQDEGEAVTGISRNDNTPGFAQQRSPNRLKLPHP